MVVGTVMEGGADGGPHCVGLDGGRVRVGSLVPMGEAVREEVGVDLPFQLGILSSGYYGLPKVHTV